MKKKTLFILAGILIILDLLGKLFFIGYNMNMLYIAVIIFALSNFKRNVKAFSAILLIAIIFMGINITSKTYLKIDSYKLEIPKFTYKYKKGYKSLLPIKATYNNIMKITSKFEPLDCCLNSFYDKKNDMTIKTYSVNKDNIITIEVNKGNLCTNIKDKKYKNFKEIEDLEYQSIEDFKENGYYIYTDNGIFNESEFTNFKKNVENNKSDFIRMITYNDNKRYLVFDIKYENDMFQIRFTNKFNDDFEKVSLTRELMDLNLENNTIIFNENDTDFLCAKHN